MLLNHPLSYSPAPPTSLLIASAPLPFYHPHRLFTATSTLAPLTLLWLLPGLFCLLLRLFFYLLPGPRCCFHPRRFCPAHPANCCLLRPFFLRYSKIQPAPFPVASCYSASSARPFLRIPPPFPLPRLCSLLPRPPSLSRHHFPISYQLLQPLLTRTPLLFLLTLPYHRRL